MKNNILNKFLVGVPIAIVLSVTGCGHDNHDMSRNSISNMAHGALENGRIATNESDIMDRSNRHETRKFLADKSKHRSDFGERGNLGQGNSFGDVNGYYGMNSLEGNADFAGGMYGLNGNTESGNLGMGINSGALVNDLGGLLNTDYSNDINDNAITNKNSLTNKNGFKNTINAINDKTNLQEKAKQIANTSNNDEKVTVGDVVRNANINNDENLVKGNGVSKNKKNYANSKMYRYA